MSEVGHRPNVVAIHGGYAFDCSCGWRSEVFGGSFGKSRAVKAWEAHADEEVTRVGA